MRGPGSNFAGGDLEPACQPLLAFLSDGAVLLEIERDACGQVSNGICGYSNPSFETLTGIKEPTGKYLDDIFPGLELSPAEIIQAALDNDVYQQSLYREVSGQRLQLSFINNRSGTDCVILLLKGLPATELQTPGVLLNEAGYHAIFESIEEGFCIYELIYDCNGQVIDLKWIEVNPAYEKQTGLRDVVGKLHSELSPGTERSWLEVYDRVVKTGEAIHFDSWHAPTARWYSTFSSRIEGYRGRRVAVLFSDITKRKKEEERQLLLLRLSDALRPIKDAFEIQRVATAELMQQLDAGWVYYIEVAADGDSVVAMEGHSKDLPLDLPPGTRISDFSRLFLPTYAEGKTVVYADVMTHADFNNKDRLAFRRVHTSACIAVPLIKDKKLLALLGVSSLTPRSWDEGEVTLVEEIAQRTWASVERARAAAALQKSEARYRSLFNNINEGLSVYTTVRNEAGKVVDMVYREVNEAAERQTGVSSKALIGQRLSDMSTKADFDIWMSFHTQVADTGEPATGETYSEFTGRWFEFSIYRSAQDENSVFIRDISIRKHTEAALREREEKYRTLFGSIDEGFSIIELILDDSETVTDYWHREDNPVFTRMTGIHNPVGKRMSELLPYVEPEWYRMLEQIYRTGEPVRVEYPVKTLGLWFSTYMSRVGGDGSKLVACIYDDITERKVYEQRQAYLLKLSDALRPLTDPAGIEGIACCLLGEELKAGRTFYSEISEAENHVKINQEYLGGNSPSLIGVHPLSAYSWVLPHYYKGNPIVINNVYETDLISPENLPAMESTQVISYCLMPLIKNGVLVGTLTASEPHPRVWKDYEVILLSETAERIWEATERAKAEAALARSEEQNRALVSQTSVGVLEADLSGTITFLNEKMKQLFRLKQGQGIGANVLELTAAAFREATIAKLERLVKEDRSFESEKRMIRADGSEFWANVSVAGIKKGSPQIQSIVAVVIDITTRKLAEEALQESEARISKLVTLMPAAVYTCDAKGRINFFNDRAAELWGRKPLLNEEQDKFCGSFRMWTPDGKLLRHEDCPMADAVKEGRPARDLEVVIEHPTGERLVANVNIDPLFGRQGEIRGAINVFTDITERKQTEQTLRQLLKQRDEFIGVASHELKTPVTSMKAYAEMVLEELEEQGDKDKAELLTLLNAQIERLTKLINHLLDTTKISEGQLPLVFEKIDLNQLVKERVGELNRTSGHHISLKLHALKPILADPERIGQVIINLVSNAIKYSPEFSTIAIETAEEDGFARVSVTDKGFGIPAADQEKIFERFFRVTSNGMDTFPGMGLGLYITAQIVKRHNGTISVQSEPGKGSVFSLTLPYNN